ncbi:hypothetical protein QWY85_12555 [Neolewinella lacunae]|uniref:Uncharacterized protein n=1 Tax=Neolewinella lacunae TaxID=1517758 RepID=A0A923PIM8_9BACT|nr:hypothetical protein [Neolewinella lacunae]MBC6993989.1 hypothetical protein [Neolewinella lacunae]MDN3635496.1 hypothetical protein [Neolewinella lacunae]
MLHVEYKEVAASGNHYANEVYSSAIFLYDVTTTSKISRGKVLDLAQDKQFDVMSYRGEKSFLPKSSATEDIKKTMVADAEYEVVASSNPPQYLLGYKCSRFVIKHGPKEITVLVAGELDCYISSITLKYPKLKGFPLVITEGEKTLEAEKVSLVDQIPLSVLDGKYWTKDQMDEAAISMSNKTFDELMKDMKEELSKY